MTEDDDALEHLCFRLQYVPSEVSAHLRHYAASDRKCFKDMKDQDKHAFDVFCKINEAKIGFFKQITTLGTGSVVVVTTFVREGNFEIAIELRDLLSLSLLLFIVSIGISTMAMWMYSLRYRNAKNIEYVKNKNYHKINRESVTEILALISFVGGIIALAIAFIAS